MAKVTVVTSCCVGKSLVNSKYKTRIIPLTTPADLTQISNQNIRNGGFHRTAFVNPYFKFEFEFFVPGSLAVLSERIAHCQSLFCTFFFYVLFCCFSRKFVFSQFNCYCVSTFCFFKFDYVFFFFLRDFI